MDNLKTKTLLNIVSGLGGLGMLILAAIALYQIALLHDHSDRALHQSEQTTQALVQVETAAVEFKRQVQEWKDILLRGNDPEKFTKYRSQFEQREAKMDESLRAAAATFGELEATDKVQKIEAVIKLHQEMGVAYREAMKAYVQADPLAYRTVDKLVAGMDRPLTEALTKLVAQVETDASADVRAAQRLIDEKQSAARMYFGVIVVLAFLLVFGSGQMVASRVYRRLGGEPLAAAEVAHAVAHGDLTVTVPPAPAASLMGAMGKMKTDLLEIVGAFAGGVEKTQDSAVVLEQAADAINANSAQQADATASIAATIEELSASLQSLSVSADVTRDLSSRAGQEAAQGGALIQSVVADVTAIAGQAQEVSSVVAELEQHQQNVSQIVKVIAGIANQTNLLALNAAIEAARAGEQGRGFAVVADEVRNLAERTSQSTLQIRDMIASMHGGTSAATGKISEMLASVEASVARAGVAEQAVSSIVTMSSRTDDSVCEITSALHEHSRAVEDIAHRIEEVAAMSAANREQVDQLSGNAGKMSLVASDLLQQTRRFKLQQSSGVDFF